MSIVIVAIPSDEDHIWKVSSEKVPHLTLLFLGDEADPDKSQQITEFVQHITDETLHRFGLVVDHRGTLGPDNADVLFFEKDSYDIKEITQARQAMLLNPVIKQLYNAADQYPEWTPHTTLGYPATPAHEDTRDYPITWVNFDRLAVWFDDSEGPEFRLKPNYVRDLVMTDISYGGVTLTHHGVKGQKWGVRRDRITGAVEVNKAKAKKEIAERTGSDVVVRTKPGSLVRTVGGNKLPAHEDAVKARTAEQKAKKSTLDSLSNQELQGLVTRMNLEQQYRNLATNETRGGPGEKYVNDFLDKNGDKLYSKAGPYSPIIKQIVDQTRKNVTGNKALQSGKVKQKGEDKQKKKGSGNED